MQAKRQRQDVRLLLKSMSKGVVFLRGRGIPAAACTLVELSEGGCRCIAPTGDLDENSGVQLKKKTEPGLQLSIDLSAPPHLPGVHLDVEVMHAKETEDGDLELGLQFLSVESYERELLSKALNAIASEKLTSPAATPPPAPRSALREIPPQTTEPEIVPALPRIEGHSVEDNGNKAGKSGTGSGIRKVWFAPPDATTISPNDPYRGKRLGEILKELGKVSEDHLNEAHAATRASNEKLGRYLLRSGWLSPIDLCSALALQSGLPMIDLSEFDPQPSLAGLFSYLTMLRYEFIPFHEANELLSIATTQPIPPSMLTDLEQKCGKKIKVFLGEDDQVMMALHALRPTKERKLRRQRRIKLSVPVVVRFFNRQLNVQASGSVYTGKTIDVSETGFMISMQADLRRHGTCVQLSFALPPQTVEAICSIRYVKEQQGENKSEGPFVIGLQVMDMSHDHHMQLKEICVRVGMWNLKDSKSK